MKNDQDPHSEPSKEYVHSTLIFKLIDQKLLKRIGNQSEEKDAALFDIFSV